MSLKPQTGGFLGMAELFSSLSNEQVWVSAGIGDWVTQLLQNQGHPVDTVVPKEGGLMWTDSWTIAKASKKPDLAYAWIGYIASPEGQVLAATLPAFSRNIPNREGWKLLNEQKPEWAKRLRHHFNEPNVIDEYKTGKIFPRALPVKQTIEQWNEAWTVFKNA
jgi:spermidine/putrescine transport system substrate-binding protein